MKMKDNPKHHCGNSTDEIPFVYRGLNFHEIMLPDGEKAVSIMASENNIPVDCGGYQVYGRTYTKEQACERAMKLLNEELKKRGIRRYVDHRAIQ
jgi:hypothetical protein